MRDAAAAQVDGTRPLAGLRVVEASAFVAAPSGGMTLAQLGADVIRLDDRGGGLDAHRWPVTPDGVSLYWAGLNKGKRSVCLDMRGPEGQELATMLMTRPGPDGGLLLTNLPTRGWLSYPSLRARRDDMIVIAITGDRDGRSAVDYTVNAALGYPAITGPEQLGGPVNHALPAWDLLAGQAAAVGLLAAERTRSRTGRGGLVRLALSDVGLATVANLGHVADLQINSAERPRIGNDLYGTFGRDFPTRDGRRVMVVAVTRRQWDNLCAATALTERMSRLAALLDLDFRREGDRYEARQAIATLIEPWCAARTLDEVRRRFDEHEVCWGPFQTFRQLVDEDPRCSVENPLFELVDQPGVGTYLAPGSPLEFVVGPRPPVVPAPVLGQHTDEVLAGELGLSEFEIARLHERGVVAGHGVAE